MNREVDLGSHSLSNSSSVPDKPYGFCGRKAPIKKWKNKMKETDDRAQGLCEQGDGPGLSLPIPFFPPSLIIHTVSVDSKAP